MPVATRYGVGTHAYDRASSAGLSDEDKPKCWSNEAGFGQYPMLTGEWEDSSVESFKGFYDATVECPDYGHDFDCRRPYKGAAPEQISS